MKYETKLLKEWCKSMIDVYHDILVKEHPNEFSFEDLQYIQITQFYNENRVDGILSPNSKQTLKHDWLSYMAQQLNTMYIIVHWEYESVTLNEVRAWKFKEYYKTNSFNQETRKWEKKTN